MGVGVLLDVEVLLQLAAGVGQERPLGAHLGTELDGLDDAVGGDGDDLGVGDGDLRVVGGQLEVLLVVLRAVAAAREYEDHRVGPLQLAQPPPGLGVVGQLVVGEDPAGCDVGTHGVLLMVGLVHPAGAATSVSAG
jgi:hypothetical protein